MDRKERDRILLAWDTATKISRNPRWPDDPASVAAYREAIKYLPFGMETPVWIGQGGSL